MAAADAPCVLLVRQEDVLWPEVRVGHHVDVDLVAPLLVQVAREDGPDATEQEALREVLIVAGVITEVVVLPELSKAADVEAGLALGEEEALGVVPGLSRGIFAQRRHHNR